MADEEISRTEFGLDKEQFKFETKEKESDYLLNKDDYDTTIKNPMQVVYSNFNRLFIRNEVFADDQFNQLNDLLVEYSKLVSMDLYKNMEIIKLSSEIINKFTNWASAMRQNVFLAKEKIEEMKKVNTNLYVLKGQNEEISEKGILSKVEKSISGDIYAVIDGKLKPEYPAGTQIRIHKIKKSASTEEKV